MTVAVKKTYGGRSAEERERERRAQFLEAGLELLGTSGWSAATVHAICAEANLSQRYFYESFESREALVLAVVRRVYREVRDALAEVDGAKHASHRARSRAYLDALVRTMVDDPRKGRAALVESYGIETFQRVRHEALRSFARLVARPRDGSPTGPDPQREFAALMVVGGLFETMVAFMNGGLAMEREAFVDHATDFLVKNLGR